MNIQVGACAFCLESCAQKIKKIRAKKKLLTSSESFIGSIFSFTRVKLSVSFSVGYPNYPIIILLLDCPPACEANNAGARQQARTTRDTSLGRRTCFVSAIEQSL